MADRLSYKLKITYACSMFGILLPSLLFAQVINDPTRPPMVMKESIATDTPVETGPRLQSIISSEGRKVAIISGKKIALGENYGDAKVVQINETSVMLKRGNSTQVLKLFPNVQKLPPKSGKNVTEEIEQTSEKSLGSKP